MVARAPRLAFLSLAVLLGACGSESTSPQDQNPFVGTWLLVRFDGADHSENFTWTFSESTVTIQAEGETFVGGYSFEDTKTPKTIDIQIQGENLAIYDFPTSTSLILKLMSGASVRATNFDVETGYDLEEFTKQ